MNQNQKLKKDSEEGFPEGYWELVRDGVVVGTCGTRPNARMVEMYGKMGMVVGKFVTGPETRH